MATLDGLLFIVFGYGTEKVEVTSLQHSGLNVERNGGEREGKRGRETMSTDGRDQ